MANTLSNSFKVLYLLFFFINLILILPAIDPSLFDPSKPLNVFIYFVAIFGIIVTVIGAIIVSMLFSFLGIGGTAAYYFQFIAGAVFPYVDANELVAITGATSQEKVIEALINDFILSIGVMLAFILIPIAILSTIGFIIRGDTKLSVYSFISFNLLLAFAMYTQNLNLDLSVPESSNFFAILFSPIFIVALLLYLMLEFSFQAAYTINIMDPMKERETRITEHLRRIQSYVPKSSAETAQTPRVTSQQTKRFDILAASYMREMIEKKIFRKGQDEISNKAMLRLQSYTTGLKSKDRDFLSKITAKSAQPDTGRIVRQLIPQMIYRLSFVILISLFILNPLPFLEFLQSFGLIYFPQLLDSIELSQPEFRTTVIFNVVLIIYLISAGFNYFNRKVIESGDIQRVETLVEFSQEGLDVPDIAEEEFDEFDDEYD
jgi:hypothetical protein